LTNVMGIKAIKVILGVTASFTLLAGCHAQAILASPAKAVTAASGPYTWRTVKISAGGFVDGLIFNPAAKDVLYARTDIGGPYRWDAATQRWIPLLDWLGPADWNLTGVESIGIDPTNARRVYLAVGTYTNSWAGNGAILRSNDAGRTWQRTDLPFKNGGNMDGRSAGERLSVDLNKDSVLFFGSRDNGLWHSPDYGATWSQVSSFPVQGQTNGVGVVFTLFQRSSGVTGKPTPVIYVGVQQDGPSLYKSTDGGASWTPIPGQPTGLDPHHAVLSSDGSLYVTYGNAPGPNGMSAGAVWKLDTKTGDWTDVSPIKAGQPGASGYAGLALDFQHPKTLMVATMDRWNPGDTLFRSTDGGQTWDDIGPKTTRNWSLSPYMTFGNAKASLGWWLGALAIDPFRPGHVLYGTGATIWASTDVTGADSGLPTHWSIGADGLEETAVTALLSPPTGPPLISGLGDIGGFRHDDLNISPQGGMWTNPSINSTTGLDFAEANPAFIVRVGNGSRGQSGAYSTNGATSWTPFPTNPPGSRGGGTVAVSADGNAIIWTPNGGAPSLTRDRGTTWTACTGLSPHLQVISDRMNPSRFYAEDGNAGTLYASNDGGATFTPTGQSLPQGTGTLNAVPGHEGDLWLTVNGTLEQSTDGGETFTSVPTVTGVKSLGFGKAAPGQTDPALYVIGTVHGLAAFYRSDDGGANWVHINDAQHQYATADIIIGDPRIYGRAYVGTNGRGILYGDPATK
jgi:hypothetical protein